MDHSVRKIRIGTRGSPLALKQTDMVCARLGRVHPGLETEIVVIKTSGDWTPEQGDTPLDKAAGGKALFAKEIEEHLLAGKIDAAVHSMKDMESVLPDGLTIDCVLPREDVRDAVVLRDKNNEIQSLRDLPENAILGTCSIRRQGFLLARRPDLQIEHVRGNVGTRLEKLQAGKLAGILLAKAGLKRLKMDKNIAFLVPVEEMLPAAGQGAIGIETARKNKDLLSIFSQINSPEALLAVECERAALAALGGGCHTPVGAYALLEGKKLWLRVCVVAPDGSEKYEEQTRRSVSGIEEAERAGREIGRLLKERVPPELLHP